MPMYKGEGDKCECSNTRGISLCPLTPIKRVRGGTEWAIGEEHCGFRQGRGCMDQLFAIRQVCVKSK